METDFDFYAIEAKKIAMAIFRMGVTTEDLKLFAQVSQFVEMHWTLDQRNSYHRLVKNNRELESLEFISRLFGKNKMLTLKFKLFIIVLESRLDTSDWRFKNEKKNLFKMACLAIFRIPVILIRGLYQMRQAV